MEQCFRGIAIRLAGLSLLLLGIPPLCSHLQAAQQRTQLRTTPDHARDRTAIGQALQRFLDAWNNHDAHAFASTFTEDCDFTNVAGMHAHGRRSVESFHAPLFHSIFKDSHQTAQIRSIRFLTARLAEVDVDWQMTRARSRDGTRRANRIGLLVWVMSKQSDGTWLIEIMHNTDLTDILQQRKSAETAK
jgi:uncharacterized protein (TIGR02246 family)